MLAPIRIPETKPATELIDGRLVQKLSPKRRHQALEKRWMAALDAWAERWAGGSPTPGTSCRRATEAAVRTSRLNVPERR